MLTRLFLLLALAWSGLASATVLVTQRYDWFYAEGYFHKAQASGGGWIETINATDSFYFAETARNAAFVELYDASRSMSVRLTATSMLLKGPGDADFRAFKSGGWDDRRLFLYQTVDGQPAYLNLFTSEIWHWNKDGQASIYLRETFRNKDQIQLYSGAGKYTISLLDGELWLKVDGNAWFKYATGHW